MAVRIVLSDDHPMFREGLKVLLEKNTQYCVVGQGDNGYETLELIETLQPDIAILDISMPGPSGLEVAEHISDMFPDIRIVMLSRHADSILVERALKAGAAAYVHKDAAYNELIIALDAVAAGKKYLSPAILGPVVSHFIHTATDTGAMQKYSTLTDREKEVFRLLSKGRSRSLIAETLNISPKTVDRHKSNLLGKLQISSDEEIEDFAREVGISEE
jgi:DNA-binding NarL/FixJ family response regulator